MSQLSGAFPLELAVFPGELLALHIFEPRYKQLIGHCLEHNEPFVIPVVLNGKVSAYGSLGQIEELVHTFEDGCMDIRIRGKSAVEITDFFPVTLNRLHGAVMYRILPCSREENKELQLRLHDLAIEFYELTGISKIPDLRHPVSFELGHKLGLSLEQETELLVTEHETARLLYLVEHLKRTISTLQEIENTRRRIAMNGHFRKLKTDGI